MEALHLRIGRAAVTTALIASITACSGDDQAAERAPATSAAPIAVSEGTTTASRTSPTTTTTTSTSTTTTTLPEPEVVLEPVATLPGRHLTPFAADGDGMLALSEPDVVGAGAPPSVVRIDAAGTVTQETIADDASALLAAAPGDAAFQVNTFGADGCSVRALNSETLSLGPPLALDGASCSDSITADTLDPTVMLVAVPTERAFLRVDTRTHAVERVGLESVAPEGWGVYDVLSLPEANYAVLFVPDGAGLRIARADRATGTVTATDLESSVEERQGRLLLHLPDRSLLLDPATLTTTDARPSDLPAWVLRDTAATVTVEHRDPATPEVLRTASIERAAVSARPQVWSGLETSSGYLLVAVESADDTGAGPVTHIFRATLRLDR